MLHSVQLDYLKNLQRPTQTQAAQKQGKETRSNLSTRALIKQQFIRHVIFLVNDMHEGAKTAIHTTCNISSHDMHEGAKEQSVLKDNNSADNQISMEPQHNAQPISRWKSSIRDLQVQHSADHHSSMVFRRYTSAGHHLDDSIGPFRTNQLKSKLKTRRNHLLESSKGTEELSTGILNSSRTLQPLRAPSTCRIGSPNCMNQKILRRRAQLHQSCSKRRRKSTAISRNRVRMNSKGFEALEKKIRNIGSQFSKC
ncbi:hypothetical protein F511_31406 [Dorcoceras hygrometricum]|uniref:Uncharacterized protein n=1 Tax=Dorcoceras hygrometricum TaxID=472368 RepID=A0A2Z7DEM2_9LAMI|nr:hypothetical protein F511_31406 [Dorcoceras hygrometricum]